MTNMGIVYGSEAQAKALVVGKDTVYVHTNIELINEDSNLYKYNEIQYDKDEYIELISEKNQQLQDAMDVLLTEVLPGVVGSVDNE